MLDGFFGDFLNRFQFKKQFYLPIVIALFFNLLCWLLIFFKIPATSDYIPLSYHIFFGIDWLGPWAYIFFFPLIALLFFLVNSAISFLIDAREPFFSKLLRWSSVVIQILILLNLSALVINFY